MIKGKYFNIAIKYIISRDMLWIEHEFDPNPDFLQFSKWVNKLSIFGQFAHLKAVEKAAVEKPS